MQVPMGRDSTGAPLPPFRILALVALVVLASQALALWFGDTDAISAAVLCAVSAIAFLVSDRLRASGHARGAVLLTASVLLAMVPAAAILYEASFGVPLIAVASFVLVVPHLHGRPLAAFGSVAVLFATFAVVAFVLPLGRVHGMSVFAVEAATAICGAALAGTFVVVVAWRTLRSAEDAGRRYAQLVRDLPVGVIRTTPDGRILEANETFARIIGAPDIETALGMSSRSLYADPGDRGRVMVSLNAGELVVSELPARTLDGRSVWFRLSARAHLDEQGKATWYDSVLEDITGEREQRDARARYGAIVDAAGVAVVSQTTEGVILGWNAAAERLYAWPADTVGKTAYDVSPSEEWDAIRASTMRAAAGERIGPFDVERLYNGRQMFLSVMVTPVHDDAGRVTGIASVARDVTEEHLLLDGQRRLAVQLQEARRQEEIGRLAGGVAHEFNNRLAVIRGFAEQLTSELPQGTEPRDAADRIVAASDGAAVLVHGLLAFASRQVLRPELVDVDVIVASHLPAIRRALGSGVALVIEPSPAPALVQADPTGLADALVSLVLHARDAMPSGGTVRIATRIAPAAEGLPATSHSAAWPEGVASPNEVVVTVSDTGPGLSDPEREHLFDPFYVGVGDGLGTGLGLGAAHGTVRQSGGRIDVRTGRDGTSLEVRLPLAGVGSSLAPAPRDRTAAAASVTPVTILVVDDDAVVRTLAKRILARAGYEVLEAADAAQAQVIAASDGDRLSLLVSDVIMPGMHGPDLVRTLRGELPELPVLFMSGYAADEVDGKSLDERTRLLLKPFAPEELVAAAGELVHRGPVGSRLRDDLPGR